MKLRIKGNSIRIRLNKTEVAIIAGQGYLEEKTHIGSSIFTYALQRVDSGETLSAMLSDQTITMTVPRKLTEGWPDNHIISFEARMPLSDQESLYLLLEKDFVCLDHTTEDQSDNYPNPNKTC